MLNLSVKKSTTLQWYIHELSENWFCEQLKNICSDDEARIYDRLSHRNHENFKAIKYVEINCNNVKAIKVQAYVNQMIRDCQYKLPWINDRTYYIEDNIHSATKLQKIKAALTDNAWNKCIQQMQSFQWFGTRHIMVYQFSTNLRGQQKDKVDEHFRLSVDEKIKENPFFICLPLRFHRACSAPSPMYMSPLHALEGKYLQYLTLTDLLSLELAHNDHRFIPKADDYYFVTDIDRHVRQRLPILYNKTKQEHILLNYVKLPEVLCYFIYKYHKHFNTFYIPNVLTQFDRESMSYLFGINVLNKENYDINIQFVSPTLTELIFLNYKSFGNRAKNFTVVKDNPFIQRLPYTFQYIIKTNSIPSIPALTVPKYNPNEFIEVYIKNQQEFSGKYINDLFLLLIDQFKYHDRQQSKLVLDQIDFEKVQIDVFRKVLKIFDCVEFLHMRPTRSMLETLKFNIEDIPSLNFKDCLLTNTDVVLLSLSTLHASSRIQILGDNNLDLTVSLYIEIILAQFSITKDPLQLLENWNIENFIFPNIGYFANKFDWTGAHLQCEFINDHTNKYEITVDGKVIDLFCELSGYEYESAQLVNCKIVSQKPCNITPIYYRTDEDISGSSPHNFFQILKQCKLEYKSNSTTATSKRRLKLLFNQFDFEELNNNLITDGFEIFDLIECTSTELTLQHIQYLKKQLVSYRTVIVEIINEFPREMCEFNLETPAEFKFIFALDHTTNSCYLEHLTIINKCFPYSEMLKNEFVLFNVKLEKELSDNLERLFSIIEYYSFKVTVSYPLTACDIRVVDCVKENQKFMEIRIQNEYSGGNQYLNNDFELIIEKFGKIKTKTKLVLNQINLDPIRINVFRKVLQTFNYVEFINTKLTPSLLEILKSTLRNCVFKSVNFVGGCNLSNEDVIFLCSVLLSSSSRINILGENNLDLNVYTEIVLAQFDRNKQPFDLLEHWPIENNMFPNISGLTLPNNFNWAGVHLQCVYINEATIKYEFIKNGNVVDLYCEINGVEYEPFKSANQISLHEPNRTAENPLTFCFKNEKS